MPEQYGEATIESIPKQNRAKIIPRTMIDPQLIQKLDNYIGNNFEKSLNKLFSILSFVTNFSKKIDSNVNIS